MFLIDVVARENSKVGFASRVDDIVVLKSKIAFMYIQYTQHLTHNMICIKKK